MLKAGVVILNYNTYKITKQLVNLIKDYNCLSKIIVVDNCSTNNSYEELLCLKNNKVHILKTDANKGYSYGNNFGIQYLEQFDIDVVVIANPDVVFSEKVIDEILNTFSSERYNDYGILSTIRTDGKGEFTQRQYWKLPNYFDELINCLAITRKIKKKNEVYKIEEKGLEIKTVDVVPGSFFAARLKYMRELGYFDENVFLFYEENILAYKMKEKGYKEGILLNVQYKHVHEESSTQSLAKSSQALKITMQSSKYYNKKYLEIGKLKMNFLKLIMKYSYYERIIIYKIKNVF